EMNKFVILLRNAGEAFGNPSAMIFNLREIPERGFDHFEASVESAWFFVLEAGSIPGRNRKYDSHARQNPGRPTEDNCKTSKTIVPERLRTLPPLRRGLRCNPETGQRYTVAGA